MPFWGGILSHARRCKGQCYIPEMCEWAKHVLEHTDQCHCTDYSDCAWAETGADVCLRTRHVLYHREKCVSATCLFCGIGHLYETIYPPAKPRAEVPIWAHPAVPLALGEGSTSPFHYYLGLLIRGNGLFTDPSYRPFPLMARGTVNPVPLMAALILRHARPVFAAMARYKGKGLRPLFNGYYQFRKEWGFTPGSSLISDMYEAWVSNQVVLGPQALAVSFFDRVQLGLERRPLADENQPADMYRSGIPFH